MKNFKHILIILFLLGSGTKIQAQYFIGFYTDKYDSDIQNDGSERGSDSLTKKIHKEIQVKESSSLKRCHRSHLVNLKKVKNISGNAQGLKLELINQSEMVPVSRNYIPIIK